MKKSLIIAIVVIVVLILVSGIYYQVSKPTNNLTPKPNITSGNSVLIKDFIFSPSELTINVGDNVIWTNQDSAPHKILSDSGNELSSDTLAKGQTYSHTFILAGTYNYYCSIHPSMKAKIIVK